MGVFLIVSKKTENAQKCRKLSVYGTFIILLRNFYVALFLYKGVQICRFVFVGVFQGLYRQSGCTEIFGTAFLFLPFYRIIHKG